MKKPMHSFARRLTRRILLLWILMMSAVAAIVFLKAESGMTGLSDAHYADVLDLTNEKVQGILRSVEVFSNRRPLVRALCHPQGRRKHGTPPAQCPGA